jgi:hypothetical protein
MTVDALPVQKVNGSIVTLDSLYRRAKEFDMCVNIEESTYSGIKVELKAHSKKGSTLWFTGKHPDCLITAFLTAFEEASMMGMGYGN